MLIFDLGVINRCGSFFLILVLYLVIEVIVVWMWKWGLSGLDLMVLERIIYVFIIII